MPPCSSDTNKTYIHIRKLVIYCDPPLQGDDGLLRKAITARLPDRHLLHGHDPKGQPTASYVRYRITEGIGQLIAWGPALEVVEKIRDELDQLRLQRQTHDITAIELHDRVDPFGAAPYPLTYTSVSPWLALNESNHRTYLKLVNPRKQRALLNRIMVGNLLALAKHADHWVDDRIVCKIEDFDEQPIMHKGTELLGFNVRCIMNFNLPQWLGVGKLTSKGYGLFRPIDGMESDHGL